jgi:hypothetical protein
MSALLAVGGCSSSSKSTPSTTASTSAPAATTAPAQASGTSTAAAAPSTTATPTATPETAIAPAASGGKLTVTGSVTATLTEATNADAVKCKLDAAGSASNIIEFDGDSGSYNLQMSIPAGTTTFPNETGKSGVFFYNDNNSKLEWGASTTAKGGTGTVTRAPDNKSGTVDVQMTDAAPPGSPPLAPIHVSGSWTC